MSILEKAVYTKENGSYLQSTWPFNLQRFALHFHKCPHLSTSGAPSNQIQLAYFYPLDLIEASRLAFVHPVLIVT